MDTDELATWLLFNHFAYDDTMNQEHGERYRNGPLTVTIRPSRRGKIIVTANGGTPGTTWTARYDGVPLPTLARAIEAAIESIHAAALPAS